MSCLSEWYTTHLWSVSSMLGRLVYLTDKEIERMLRMAKEKVKYLDNCFRNYQSSCGGDIEEDLRFAKEDVEKLQACLKGEMDISGEILGAVTDLMLYSSSLSYELKYTIYETTQQREDTEKILEEVNERIKKLRYYLGE